MRRWSAANLVGRKLKLTLRHVRREFTVAARLEVKTEGRISHECAPSSLRPPVSSLVKAGEACGEIAAPEKGADGGDGIRAQWSHGAAVVLLVAGDEIIPGVMDDLPEGRGARAARAVNRGHKGCSWEHSSGQCGPDAGWKKYPSQSDAHRSRRISRFIRGCTLLRRTQ